MQSHDKVQYTILIVWKGENMIKMPMFCLYDQDDKNSIGIGSLREIMARDKYNLDDEAMLLLVKRMENVHVCVSSTTIDAILRTT